MFLLLFSSRLANDGDLDMNIFTPSSNAGVEWGKPTIEGDTVAALEIEAQRASEARSQLNMIKRKQEERTREEVARRAARHVPSPVPYCR